MLTDGFRGVLTPPPISLRYRAALVAVTLAMIALPLLYVAVALAALWGVLTLDVLLIGSGLTGRALLFGLAAVTGGGGTAVLFMFKPLLAPRRSPPEFHVVDRDREATLFGFVDRLCSVIGAPPPSRIVLDCNVNASASFTRGFRSFFGSDLTLTIGLPLVAGFTLREFAGVLAHEFGHFSQGTAMRLTYVIRSISHWFARVVYERDEWDDGLKVRANGGGWIGMLAQIAQGSVWLTRKILWAFMWCGQAISALAMRQMEFDADRYEVHIAGTAAFETSTARLRELSLASAAATAQLRETWSDRRLVADFPGLVMRRLATLAPETVAPFHEQALAMKTRALDSHPSDADRTAAARAIALPGMFTLEMPASVLFPDFSSVCRAATQKHYQLLLGDELSRAEVEPLDRYLADEAVDTDAWEALRQVCGDVIVLSRLQALGQIGGEASESFTSQSLQELQNQMNRLVSPASEAAVRLRDLETRSLEIQGNLAPAEVRGTGNRRTLNTVQALEREQKAATDIAVEIAGAAGPVESYLRLAGARMAAAISSSAGPGGTRAGGPMMDEQRGMIDAYNILCRHRPDVEDIRLRLARLQGLLQPIIQDAQNNQDLVPAILDAVRDLGTKLRELQNKLRPAPYPFRSARDGQLLSHSVVETVPSGDDVNGVMNATVRALQMADKTHVRLVGHLCRIVRQVETAHEGLDSPA